MTRSPSAARLGATLVALALLLPSSAATAALFVPSKTADGADGACDADCSLREAVIAANASPGEDVILLGPGAYALTLPGTDDAAASGDLDVAEALVVAGEGASDTVIDGGSLDRVFDVAAGAALELRDLTLRNGRAEGAGGAVDNGGELTVLRAVLSGNRSVAGHGGAVHSHGLGVVLTVRDSTLDHNVAGGNGGAIAAGEAVTLANVTIAANSAGARGGGLYVFANSAASIDNATVAGNSAAEAGGILAESSAFTGFQPRVTNSILAGNSAPSAPDCGGAIDSSYSLVGNASGCIRPAGSNDLSGLDPKLGPLQEAGGPTPTRPLLAGSPALDSANPAAPGSGGGACEPTDQRGAQRPGGPRCDMGAFEATTACVPGGAFLCLGGGRFAVSATFQTAGGLSGTAHAVALTPDSGYFWFFDPANVELTVKVLDGCALNGRHWVFSAGMTNVRVELTATDTREDVTKSYVNPLNRTYRTRLDTAAFATCP
jgi:CSLREA domain-containing protein